MTHMTQVTNTTLVTTVEAAAILTTSRSQVARLAKAGHLVPSAKGPGSRGAYLFDRDAVERLARERAA